MSSRLKKLTMRLLLLTLILGVVAVGAFSWLCYWPLEGNYSDLMKLVPYKVDFVLRTTWEDTAEGRWVRENVITTPLHDSIRAPMDQGLKEARARIAELEGQINAAIPIQAAQFSVQDDVLAGEVVIAGNFCQGMGPEHGTPRWQEILLLSRVSWRTRCIAALKHGFIRDSLGPDLKVTALDDDVFHLSFPRVRVSPPESRAGCGGGFVMPPENEWYLRRCKGVLAISNSKRLIQAVAENSHEDISRGESFLERRGYTTHFEPGSGRLVVAVDLEPLQQYLGKTYDLFPAIKALRRFIMPRSLFKLNGALDLQSPTALRAGGIVEFNPDQAEAAVRNVWRLDSRSLREGIAEFVPAKETFLVAMVRGDPGYVMQGLVDDFLTPKQQRLWEENLRASGRFRSLDEFVRELSSKVGDTITVAAGRLNEIFDAVEYPSYYLESSSPDPMPALAIMVRIAESATPAEVDKYLADVVPALGFRSELERFEYQGFTYSRCRLEHETGDYQLATPCFMLAQNELILTNSEPYMRRILDTLKNPLGESIAKDDAFRETMSSLPQDGHVAVFADLEKLTRVPPSLDAGAQPRGFLWDHRRLHVIEAHSDRDVAIAERARLRRDYPGMDEDEIESRVADHVESFHTLEYAHFVEEYRQELLQWRRLRSLGFVLGRTGEHSLEAGLVVLLRAADSR